MTPTAFPSDLAKAAMLLMRVVKSDLMPNAPFFVLFPVARAVPPAAESVTPFVPEYVVTSPTYGNCAKQSGDGAVKGSGFQIRECDYGRL